MNTEAQVAPNESVTSSNSFGGIPMTTFKNIELINGLPGFEDLHAFVLGDLEGYEPFCALQSLDEPDISMLVIEAKLLPIWKNIEIPPRELQILEVDKSEDSEQFIILRINHNTQEFTGNIKAPIVFNPKSGAGNQVILDNANLSVEHPMNNQIS